MAACAFVVPEGENTIAGRSGESRPVKFYSSWKCPYAQRVWIGLEEKAIEYQWVEIDLCELTEEGRSGSPLPLAELRNRFPEFIACSPAGQLPAFDNHGERIYGSLIILEYIHEAFGGAPLLPTAPYHRAQVRQWTRHIDTRIVPNFERLLSSQDADSRQEARSALLEGLAEFEAAMAPEAEGPFFLGDDFSMADIALAPWWQRMCSVLRAYRKFDPSVCPRLQTWYEAVQVKPSFQRTVVDPERLMEEFSDYADVDVSPDRDTKFRRSAFPRRGSRNSKP